VAGQLAHPDPPVPQDAEHPELRQRQVVLGPDPAQHGHHLKRRPNECVDQLPLTGPSVT